MISIKKLLNLEYYVSPTDQFLAKYDQTHHGVSHSQHLEIAKYARLNKMRDVAETPGNQDNKLWEEF